MLILLPPSETKYDGGEGDPLDVSGLAFPRLKAERRRVLAQLRLLVRNRATAIEALRLGPNQHGEVDRNRMVARSPTMPALDRYTGVLFDALGSRTLTSEQRAFAHENVAIHSALFGPVAALDLIPAYRLSFDSRLPQLSLKKHWSRKVSTELCGVHGLIVDARSEGYSALGPRPKRPDSVFLRVVTREDDGRKRALNHFNKQAKGAFARALIEAGIVHSSVDSLLEWAVSEGYELSLQDGELELVVRSVGGAPGSLTATLR